MGNQWGTFTFASPPTKMLGDVSPRPSYDRRPCRGSSLVQNRGGGSIVTESATATAQKAIIGLYLALHGRVTRPQRRRLGYRLSADFTGFQTRPSRGVQHFLAGICRRIESTRFGRLIIAHQLICRHRGVFCGQKCAEIVFGCTELHTDPKRRSKIK